MTQITTATVKFAAGQPKETQYGPRINVVCTLPGGEDAKVWGNPGDPIQGLKKGQTVTLVQGKKGWEYAQQSTDATSAPAANTAPLGFKEPGNDTKKDMVDYIDFAAKMHRHCYDKALAQYKDESEGLVISEREVMATATTLFIQAMRRFNP